jgi:hypothetical protein
MDSPCSTSSRFAMVVSVMRIGFSKPATFSRRAEQGRTTRRAFAIDRLPNHFGRVVATNVTAAGSWTG